MIEFFVVSVGPDGTDIKIKKSFTFTDPFAAQKVLHLDHNSILKKEGRFVGDVLKTNSIRTPRVRELLPWNNCVIECIIKLYRFQSAYKHAIIPKNDCTENA